MSKCKKHDCYYEIRQMEHGKTMYVCPQCEKEQMDKFKELFGIKDGYRQPEFRDLYPNFPGEAD